MFVESLEEQGEGQGEEHGEGHELNKLFNVTNLFSAHPFLPPSSPSPPLPPLLSLPSPPLPPSSPSLLSLPSSPSLSLPCAMIEEGEGSVVLCGELCCGGVKGVVGVMWCSVEGVVWVV